MSLFTYHLIRTNPFKAVRLHFINAKKINGLHHAEVMTVMTLGSGIFSPKRFLFRQVAVFAQWQNEEALNQFLTNHKTGKILKSGWYLKLNFIRKWGSFSKFDIPAITESTDNPDEPVVAVTIARMKFLQIPRFIKWGRPVEKLVRDHPGSILSLASIRLPNTVSTFSIWKSQKEMVQMVHGHSAVPMPKRHSDAMKERERKDFHFEFTTLRFKVISEEGMWKGKSNYFPKSEA